MTSATELQPQRLAPELRRRQLLDAGLRCLAREGLSGFTMEGVAREAGVTGALPRHYFGTREGMLLALCQDLLEAVRASFKKRDRPSTLMERFEEHLDFLERNPWGHTLWLHGAEVDPALAGLAEQARRELVILSGFGRQWDAMSRTQQLAGMGWIGYAESVISEWIDGGCRDRQATLEALLAGADQLEVLEHTTRRGRVSPAVTEDGRPS